MRRNKCIDCGKIIDKRSKRCYTCSNSKNAFRHGRCCVKPYCIDCGKELKNFYAKRCPQCYHIYIKESEIMRGISNPAKKPEVRLKMSKARKNKKLTKEHKKRISEALKGTRTGRNNSMFNKITITKRGIYKGIHMRSSWEIAYVKYLDKNNIK